MAVIEMQKEPRSIKSMLFIAALIIGFVALGGVIYWLVKPAAPRQVKLTGDAAKEAESTYVAPPAALPAQPPLPQAQDPGPTMVTLDLKNVTPRQAIDELAKQAKVSLRDDGRGQQQQGFLASIMANRMDVAYKNEPFWSAVLDLCKKGNLRPYADYQQPNRISFQQGSEKLGPTQAVGSCLIALESITSRFDADLTGPRPPSRSMTVGLKLFAEPKLSPYRIATVATLETAVDEKGNNLIRPRQQWDDRQGGGNQSNWMRDVSCNLLFPETAGNRIAKLSGYCSIAVAGPDKTEKIEDPLSKKNVDTKIDGVLVRMIELRRQGGNSFSARMAGDVNSPIFKEYEKFSKVVSLFDANGKEFNRSGGGYGGGRAGTFEFQVGFTGAGDASEPKELRITVPTQVKEIRVPFEFKDLPLPH